MSCEMSQEEAFEWQSRPDAWTVHVHVTQQGVHTPDVWAYKRWLDDMRKVIGATSNMNSELLPWVGGAAPMTAHGYWRKDHWGHTHWDVEPHASVWQRIEGLPSMPMALCWTAIHLVQPLVEVGYGVLDISAELTDEMLIVG